MQTFTGQVIFQKVQFEYFKHGQTQTVECTDNCLWDSTNDQGDLNLEPRVIGKLERNMTYVPIGKLVVLPLLLLVYERLSVKKPIIYSHNWE